MILFKHVWEHYISIAIIQYGKKNISVKIYSDFGKKSHLKITVSAALKMANDSIPVSAR